MKTSMQFLAIALAATVAGAAQAITVTIDPDDYTGNMTNVAPGARLYTVHANAAHNDFAFSGVYPVSGGNWAATGTKVFGNFLSLTGPFTQWEGIAVGAKSC